MGHVVASQPKWFYAKRRGKNALTCAYASQNVAHPCRPPAPLRHIHTQTKQHEQFHSEGTSGLTGTLVDC